MEGEAGAFGSRRYGIQILVLTLISCVTVAGLRRLSELLSVQPESRANAEHFTGLSWGELRQCVEVLCSGLGSCGH